MGELNKTMDEGLLAQFWKNSSNPEDAEITQMY